MDKIVRLGIGERGNVFCRIQYDGKRLSITGVEGPYTGGNCRGSCGQIVDVIIKECAPGWTFGKVQWFYAVWHRWHLNDLRAGCEHQRELGWEKYDEHPSESCPVCGYKYGSAWLFEVIPQSVIDDLAALPETDKVPAWV